MRLAEFPHIRHPARLDEDGVKIPGGGDMGEKFRHGGDARGLIVFAREQSAHAGKELVHFAEEQIVLVAVVLVERGAARAVHGLAMAGVVMVFLGAIALARQLAAPNRRAFVALVIFGFAAMAIMIAGAMSGFVGADILGRMVEGDPKLESRRMLLDYTFRINQAFAETYTVGTCAAIFLWSLEMVRTRGCPSHWVGMGWW